jgi:hypothetical protein
MTQQQPPQEQQPPAAAARPRRLVNLREFEIGQKIWVRPERKAEVTQNAKNGIWVTGKFLEAPDDESLVGSEDEIFVDDIMDIVEDE